MKKFKVSVPLDYIIGHGHIEYEVEAETVEEALELAMEYDDDGNIIVDGLEVDDCGEEEWHNATVEEVEQMCKYDID